jgi:predicted anti-sigma-YlaC factor YlaD
MDECSTIMKLMHPHLDGELDVKDSLRAQTHLEYCPACREAFLAEKAFLEILRAQLVPQPAPPSVHQRVVTSSTRTGSDAPADRPRA